MSFGASTALYFHNLGDNLFWPNILVTIAAIVAGIYMFSKDNENVQSEKAYQARWWATSMIQLSIGGWIAYALFSAAPVNDVRIEYRDKIVEKPFDRAEVYKDAYSACRDKTLRDDTLDNIKDMRCHDRALLVMEPNLKIVERRHTMFITDPYPKLFATCMGDWQMKDGHVWDVSVDDKHSLDGINMRKDRIDQCHAHALEVIQKEKNG